MKIGNFDISLKRFANPAQKDVEIGEAGTTIYSGYITDDDYVSELTGSSALVTYDKMRKSDGVVKASLLAMELPIRAANWFIEPASDDPKDKEVADFVSDCLFNQMSITWDDFLRQCLLMLPFGFMVFEKVFTAVEFDKKEMIGWKKFAPRLPSTILKWTTEAGEDGITQTLQNGVGISIPIEKLLIFSHNKEGDNWLGISVLRSAYRPWFFKSHIEKINAMAFERQGLGIPYAILPKGSTRKDREKARNMLKNIRANEQAYMLKPEGWEIGFEDMKAGTIKDPDNSIRRYNREILISVLAQFLDLGAGNTGSRALSADQSSTFHNNLTAVARQVKDIINKYAIRQLVNLNYTVAEYPKLEFSNIGLPKYADLAKAMTGLVQQGILKPDEKLEDFVRQLMNLPDKPEDEEGEEKPKEKPKTKTLKPPEDEEKEAREMREMSEFSSWRELTFAEKKVNFKDIQRKMNSAEKSLMSDIKKILLGSVNDLIRQFQIFLETTNSPERSERLKNMTVKFRSQYRKAVYNTSKETFEYGKMIAAHEMKKTSPPTPANSLRAISKNADALTSVMANDLMKAGKMTLLLSLQQNRSTTETVRKISKAVRREAENIIFNTPTLTVSGAINQGRRSTFKHYEKDIYALQRSEILDEVTCNYCMSIDGRVFRKKDSFTNNDGIHSNCRGIWVSIVKEEIDKPTIGGIPKTLRERFDTVNVFKPPKNPIIKKDSLAAEFLREKKADDILALEDVEGVKESVAGDVKSLMELKKTIDETLDDER